MIESHLDKMVKGWFIGSFTPTLLDTTDFEVGVKAYKAGDREGSHHHKIATEYTVIVSGRVRMCGREWGEGSIIIIEPGESTAFESLTDSVTVVVKVPGARNDKYVDE
ncbi:hypothetical protein [Planctomyces sp. SH-PL14]|jgi:quercetin dioxygenase-like cupin family protein|uniref:hypothetical protein n=1 Tax=Planctomyces sp. SH-PL14 TaxID=1632864 RepID=UPI00078E1359|nr:hypothetical protein [Planctomyces sp. SH-PL14]AMV20773.1 hypothetical protein VT03_22925 [Planctomyces sp. SH-PL14]